MGIRIINNVINQLGAPSIYESALASFPAAGYTGRMLVATDTFALYRDNGITFDLIGGPGTGTITGTGTAGKITKFTSGSVIGDSIITESGTVITVAGSIVATIYTGAGTGISGTAAALNIGGYSGSVLSTNGGLVSFSGDFLNHTYGLPNQNSFIYTTAAGSITSLQLYGSLSDETGIGKLVFNDSCTLITPTLGIASATSLSVTGAVIGGTIIKSGGLSSQFLKADGSIDSNTYITSAGAVTSITGTVDQVIASAATGAVILSLPQSISTTNSPLFSGLTLSNVGNVLTINGGGTSVMTQKFNSTGGNAFLGISSSTGTGLLTGVGNYAFCLLTESANNVALGTNNLLALLINTTQIVTTSSRLNVNGAIDNINFQLNVSGCLYTNSFSPTATAFTTAQTIDANTTYIFNGGAGITFTMGNPALTNKLFFVKNWSANTLTIAGYAAGINIIDTTNTAVASFLLLTGQTAILQQDGGSKTFILNIY